MMNPKTTHAQDMSQRINIDVALFMQGKSAASIDDVLPIAAAPASLYSALTGDDITKEATIDVMRELFRQFMSVLILEQTKLQQHCIYIDPRISFQEINRYFLSGCACAYFLIAVETYTDLQYNKDEWSE